MRPLYLFILLAFFFSLQTVFAYEFGQNFKIQRKSVDVSKLQENSPVNTSNKKNTNPNLVNMEKFIETVVKVNKTKGSSKKELRLMVNTLRTAILSSNMDYNKEFKKLLTKELVDFKTQPSLTVFDKVVAKTLSFLGINPPVAHAQVGIPFGGALIYPFFCPLSANWMIGLTPLPPSFPALLSYFPGTQGFASFNTPVTRFLLGAYTPPGVCIIPALIIPITIPTQGTITPMLGSSPL